MVELENAIFMVTIITTTITTNRKNLSKNNKIETTQVTMTPIKHCGYHGHQFYQVFQLCFHEKMSVGVHRSLFAFAKEIVERRHGEPIKFLFLPKMGLLGSQAGNEKTAGYELQL